MFGYSLSILLVDLSFLDVYYSYNHYGVSAAFKRLRPLQPIKAAKGLTCFSVSFLKLPIGRFTYVGSFWL